MTNAEAAYDESSKAAEESMSPTHPIRLGLALNFSVFHYEIADNRTKACELAKKVQNKRCTYYGGFSVWRLIGIFSCIHKYLN